MPIRACVGTLVARTVLLGRQSYGVSLHLCIFVPAWPFGFAAVGIWALKTWLVLELRALIPRGFSLVGRWSPESIVKEFAVMTR